MLDRRDDSWQFSALSQHPSNLTGYIVEQLKQSTFSHHLILSLK